MNGERKGNDPLSKKSTKVLLSIGLAVSLFGVAGCSDAGAGGATSAPESTEQAGAIQQPDLDGIPEVVADVNGNEISKDDFIRMYEGQFQQLAAQAQAQGSGEELDQDQLKKRTAEGMVNTELLVQEADSRGFVASEADIEGMLKKLAENSGVGSVDAFLTAVGEQGLDKAEVMSQLETQIKLDQLIADEVGDVKPTDDELRKIYDQAVAQQGQSGDTGAAIPPFEDVKPQLAERAQSQNEAEAAGALAEELRKGAEITINF